MSLPSATPLHATTPTASPIEADAPPNPCVNPAMDNLSSSQHLDHPTAIAFLEKLPDHIRQSLLDRATETEFPIEAILESAIASSLAPESLSFVDCKPGRF